MPNKFPTEKITHRFGRNRVPVKTFLAPVRYDTHVRELLQHLGLLLQFFDLVSKLFHLEYITRIINNQISSVTLTPKRHTVKILENGK